MQLALQADPFVSVDEEDKKASSNHEDEIASSDDEDERYLVEQDLRPMVSWYGFLRKSSAHFYFVWLLVNIWFCCQLV